MGCVRRSGHFLAILGLLLGLCCPALANPIDPFAFTSLGVFPTAPGSYLVQTLDPVAPTLTEPDGTVLRGVYAASGLAVFDFDSILLGSGVLLSASGHGTAPLVLLSRSDATIAGTIDVSGAGFPAGFHVSGDNGPGGGLVGAIASFHGTTLAVAGSGGGGFGGPGRDGGDAFVPPGAVTPGDPAIPVPGGRGGLAYGLITQQLVTGSGGAQGTGGTIRFGQGSGGAGGGAIEVGAAGSLAIRGAVVADGLAASLNGGGGSGGAILLHAAAVDLTGRLEALGGAGGVGDPARNMAAGGAGGGGQVAILYGRSYSGPGAVAVGNGSFTAQHSMPAPAALVMFGTGLLGVFGLAWRKNC